ncbi:hypothetical protein [uncultured Dokdonia sp.]|uniref:hypothetical protein n=1 Tax=uncultured Dokdonia sp. TaxID=575653 RepID=UPI002607FB42|nr:hypothetical protein [uncultured Dokdonia sp.]
MKKLKKLRFDKLTISKLTSSDVIMGGSGICGGRSRPYHCPPTNNNCPGSTPANGC